MGDQAIKQKNKLDGQGKKGDRGERRTDGRVDGNDVVGRNVDLFETRVGVNQEGEIFRSEDVEADGDVVEFGTK